MSHSTITVALVGNPNTGKSTLFNALTGLRQHVGNYPGVTVELKKGRCHHSPASIDVIDLPGTYSLAARSPDEMVAVDLLLGRRAEEPLPQVIVSVVDATNLDRHLYLTSQLLELGRPVVLAVNMIDTAEAYGLRIDYSKLSEKIGIPVIPIQANRGVGLEDLKKAIMKAAREENSPSGPKFPEEFEKAVGRLHEVLGDSLPTFLRRRLILDVEGYIEKTLCPEYPTLKDTLFKIREELAAINLGVPGVEARTRFKWIREVIAAAVQKPSQRPVTLTDRLDRILTHRWLGTLIFLGIMFILFQSIFLWAEPLMSLIEDMTSSVQEIVRESMPPGALRALLADGVIAGVGGVIVFLPQIMILFFFIAILEDCGYMARAAFLMDKLMSRCGLSGKSFIPLLSSVACAVPGIMATRVIEQRRDRLATILVAPLMSCSARLPVYTLLIGTFLSDSLGYTAVHRGLALFLLYMLGFIVAPLVALTLKRTVFRGDTPVFVMELPNYKRPTTFGVLRRMIDAGGAFLRRAGTIILISMILIWALLYFPNIDSHGHKYDDRIAQLDALVKEKQQVIATLRNNNLPIPEDIEDACVSAEEQRNALKAEWIEQSYLGQLGHALEPMFTPLGWDWKIGMATLASFPAREVIVGTLGIIYSLADVSEEQNLEKLGEKIRNDWKESPIRGPYGFAVAFSIMVFFALCMQCASTLAVIYRETKSWIWPIFTFCYMTLLAYAGAFITFQLGRAIIDLL